MYVKYCMYVDRRTHNKQSKRKEKAEMLTVMQFQAVLLVYHCLFVFWNPVTYFIRMHRVKLTVRCSFTLALSPFIYRSFFVSRQYLSLPSAGFCRLIRSLPRLRSLVRVSVLALSPFSTIIMWIWICSRFKTAAAVTGS